MAELLTNGPAACEHLKQAYEVLEDPVRRGIAGFLAARTLVFTGRPREGGAMSRRVAAELPDELADLRMAVEAVQPVAAVFGSGDDESLARLQRWRTESPGDGPGREGAAVGHRV